MGGSNKLSKISADETRIIDGSAVVRRSGREAVMDQKDGQEFSRIPNLADLVLSLEAPMDRLERDLNALGYLTNSNCCQSERLDQAIVCAKESISDVLRILESTHASRTKAHEGGIEIPIVEFLREIAEQLRPEMVAAGVELVENYWPAPLKVKCQPEEILLAVRSLLMHALESASMSSSIGLDWDAWVGLEVRDLGEEAEIMISNSGIGEEKRALEPVDLDDQGAFESVQGALFRRDLTLGTAQRVANSHHGTLSVEHGPHGSKVRIKLKK